MDQVMVIRHKVLQEGRSVRSVAREFGVSRNTVHKYLSEAEALARSIIDLVETGFDLRKLMPDSR